MKKLISIKEFKKLNSDSSLKKGEVLSIRGGDGTWKHERFHTNESSGFGHSSDHEDWFYGDGGNKGHVKGSVTFIDADGVHQEGVYNS